MKMSLKDLHAFLKSAFLNSQGALFEKEKISAKLKNVTGNVRQHTGWPRALRARGHPV